MIERSLRERLTLTLIALLPFHALLITLLTKVIEGPGHPPMAVLASWKEGLLGLILLMAFTEWLTSNSSKKIDWLDTLIIALLLLSLAVTAVTHGDWKLYLFGFKYDFIPLVAFLILRRVPWSETFGKQILRLLLIVGSLVALYGIATFVLPMRWFTFLGYSDMHSLYIPGGPLAAFQQIGGTMLRRIQGPMSGPNQLGIWLLIPLSIVLSSFIAGNKGDNRQTPMKAIKDQVKNYLIIPWKVHWRLAISVLLLMAIGMTFSRSAWIAAAIIVALTLWQILPRRFFWTVVLGAVACVFFLAFLFPSIFARVASSRGHIEQPIAAIRTMIEHPFGLGLGTAGPASNRISDACVMLREGDDPLWAASHQDLCVFVGAEQVQPLDRSCNCPFVTENWYLQMGVEMGWVGFVLYIVLIVMSVTCLRVYAFTSLDLNKEKFYILHSTFYILIAVSIAALFLHAWEDAAVAYTAWILLATTLLISSAQKVK